MLIRIFTIILFVLIIPHQLLASSNASWDYAKSQCDANVSANNGDSNTYSICHSYCEDQTTSHRWASLCRFVSDGHVGVNQYFSYTGDPPISLDCSSQPGTYAADCSGSSSCLPVPDESGPMPPEPAGAGAVCGTTDNPIHNSFCDFGANCLAAGGIIGNTGKCGGLPYKCESAPSKAPVPSLAQPSQSASAAPSAPDFPEPGKPCVTLSNGVKVCDGTGNSPDRPSGNPDAEANQSNAASNSAASQNGTGDGDRLTSGDIYSDGNNDGYADGADNGGASGSGTGSLNCPGCATEATQLAVKGVLDAIKSSITPPGTQPTLNKADKLNQDGVFNSDIDQQIESAKTELKTKMDSVTSEAKSLFGVNLPSGGGTLPDFYIGNIKGVDVSANFSNYSGQLSAIPPIIIVIALILALWMILS